MPDSSDSIGSIEQFSDRTVLQNTILYSHRRQLEGKREREEMRKTVRLLAQPRSRTRNDVQRPKQGVPDSSGGSTSSANAITVSDSARSK